MNVPSEILPFLWLGAAAGRTDDMLKEKGVTLVINATNGCPMSKKCCVRQVKLKCEDAPGYNLKKHFEDVSGLIQEEKKNGGKVFVHCIGGISRSSSLVLAYLVRYENMTLLDAHTLVKSKRLFIRPNAGFWEQLVQYEKEILGSNTVTMMRYGGKPVASVYQEEYSNMLVL